MEALNLVTYLNLILPFYSKIDEENQKIFLNKIKQVFDAPLLTMLEDDNSNQGRNTLFVLSLFVKFINAGYKAYLSYDNPDILVKCNHTEYQLSVKEYFLLKDSKKILRGQFHN